MILLREWGSHLGQVFFLPASKGAFHCERESIWDSDVAARREAASGGNASESHHGTNENELGHCERKLGKVSVGERCRYLNEAKVTGKSHSGTNENDLGQGFSIAEKTGRVDA